MAFCNTLFVQSSYCKSAQAGNQEVLFNMVEFAGEQNDNFTQSAWLLCTTLVRRLKGRGIWKTRRRMESEESTEK